jgi:filamentous hemagglutinin
MNTSAAQCQTRHANYKTFISSDYMLSKLNLAPALTQKKLGDAFYEQKLVSDQVTNLTGRRFLPLSIIRFKPPALAGQL